MPSVRLTRGRTNDCAQKYVVMLDADHAVTAGERDDAVGRLVETADGVDGLVGLTVSSLNDSLTGPAETIAVVQAWIDESADADAESVLDSTHRLGGREGV